MKTIAISWLLVFSFYLSFGQVPTTNEVSAMANIWLTKNLPKSTTNLKSATTFQIEEINPVKFDGEVLYHVAKLNPKGFVIVSNNKAIDPVIAYSYYSDFSFSTDSANILFWMLAKDMNTREQNLVADNKWEPEINQLKSATNNFMQWPEPGTTSTGGWLESTWIQTAPFNKFCPLDPSNNKRSVIGCVATALAQIVNYHQYIGNIQLNNNDKYTTSGEWIYPIKIDDDSNVYDFPSFNQLNSYLSTLNQKYKNKSDLTDEDKAILSFVCAIGVKSAFGSKSTGGHPDLVNNVLKEKFNYYSSDFAMNSSPSFFDDLITNMQKRLPCILSINNMNVGGHEVVCDGYNTNDFFHLNFGWGDNNPNGILSAWYNLPLGIPVGYNIINSMTYNINPVESKQYVNPSKIELLPSTKYQTKIFSVKAYDKRLKINSIQCSYPFSISTDSINFSNKIENIIVESDTNLVMYVNYTPQGTTSFSNVKIIINDTITEYINLSGLLKGNIIEAGSVSGEWIDNGLPYLVLGDIFISNNQHLKINGGVDLYFLNHSSFSILNGKLEAIGSFDHPIVFTSYNKNNGWNGLRFINSGDDDMLKYCSITHSVKVGENSSSIENLNGGGIYCDNSSPTIVNCIISNNKAHQASTSNDIVSIGGGGLYLQNSHAKIIGCIIVNNSSSNDWNFGGGMNIKNSEPLIVNCVISKNNSDIGGGLYGSNSKISLINTIIWDNYSPGNGYEVWTKKPEIIMDAFSQKELIIKNSIIKENYLPGNISDEDPQFRFPSSDYGYLIPGYNFDWRVSENSPCINAGVEFDYSFFSSIDIYGNHRILQHLPDIGAVESNSNGIYMSTDCFRNLDFKYVMVNDSLIKPIKIYNTGEQILEISDFRLMDVDIIPKYRILNSQTNNFSIQPNDSIVLNICYKPSEANADSVILKISSNAYNNKVLELNLTGMGYKGSLISGEVFGKWIKSKSPYFIKNDIWIRRNDSLIIEAGVEVLFGGNYSFTIGTDSRLLLNGSLNDSINFLNNSAYWNGLKFINTGSDDILNYVKIKGVKFSSAVYISNSSLKILNCSFVNNENVIELDGGSAIICDNVFSQNVGAIISGLYTQTECNLLFTGNKILSNDNTGTSAINISGYFSAVITNNIIYKNISLYAPVTIERGSISTFIGNNLIANNNSVNGLGISTFGPTIIKNNIICNNQGKCPNGGNIITHHGGSTLSSECIISNNTMVNNNNEARAIYAYYFSKAQIYNNIIWNNFKNNIDTKWEYGDGSADVQFNCISNALGFPENNISVNPLFEKPSNGIGLEFDGYSADWTLLTNSPCIDNGNPESGFDIEDPKNKGYALYPSRGSVRNDIGAFGGERSNNTPVANAGTNQSVNEGATVTLDGILSSDPDGNTLTYKWTAPAGITLSSTTTAKPTFTAPEVKKDSILSFYLTVNDGFENSVSDTVKITVLNVIKVGNSETPTPAFKVYPNPTTGMLTLEFMQNSGKKAVVSVSNIIGSEVFRKEFEVAKKLEVDLSDQVSGIYLLKVFVDNRQFISKVVIKRE